MSNISTDSSESDFETLDWSFQNHANVVLRMAKHPNSDFRRAILDGADFTEGDFSGSDFSRASMREINLMKSAFDGSDFRGADLRKAKMNLSNFQNCKFEGADIRGIRGRYAIWKGADWWNAKLNDDLEKVLSKKWPRPEK